MMIYAKLYRSLSRSFRPLSDRPHLPTLTAKFASFLTLVFCLLSLPQVLWSQIQMEAEVESDSPEQKIIDSNLSRSTAHDRRPHFSKDGQWITFDSQRDGNREVYVMAADGSKQRRITYHEASDGTPAISPDGKSIVFQSNRIQEYGGDRRQDLWMVDFEADRPPTRLTKDPADDAFPAFSPDGRWIVFSSSRDGGNVNIYRLSTEDATVEQLTTHVANDLWPNYSPDGKHIIFFSKRDNNDDLYMIPAEGGESQRLTTHDSSDFAPSFFPNSNRIVFISTRDGFNKLYEMTLGEEPKAFVPPAAGRVSDPRISPDGSFIIFVSDADEQTEIYRRSIEPEGRPGMVQD